MTSRTIALVIACVAALLLVCSGLASIAATGGGTACLPGPSASTVATTVATRGPQTPVGRWDSDKGRRHAKREKPAERHVAASTDRAGDCDITIGPDGWVAPVKAPVVSGFRTADRPGHDGVDLSAPRGTLTRAASAGVVVTATCNASTGNCDVDGSPWVEGCGWYVDIRHAANVTTRYCHMLSRPHVRIGARVAAGKVIGKVGSSGNSSGPHLHFEVHVGGDAGPRSAVNPEPYMAARGAKLGLA